MENADPETTEWVTLAVAPPFPSGIDTDELRQTIRALTMTIHDGWRTALHLPPLEPDERLAVEIRIAQELLRTENDLELYLKE